jgi:hypothetical protein
MELPADDQPPSVLPARPWPRDRRDERGWFWNVLSLVAIIAAAFGLGGCAQLQVTAEDLKPAALLSSRPAPDGMYLPSGSPRVLGRCWSATYEEVSAWDTWLGDDYVPCSDDHTTYTFAAEDLPADLVHGIESARSDAAVLAVEDAIGAAAAEVCGTAFADLFPTLTERQILLTWFSFIPNDREWAAGARWVRCDVGVYALTADRTHAAPPPEALAHSDSDASAPPDGASSPQLLMLPESIHDLVASVSERPADFEYCLDDPGADPDAGPLATESAVTADCDASPLWTYLGREILSAPLGAPYPGDDAVIQAAQTACSDAAKVDSDGEGWDLLYYPDEPRWNADSRTVQCWATE